VARASRHRAATYHLTIGLCVVLAALAAMLYAWYPEPYFHAMGARGLALIMLAVDVTLGPLLTWIVFAPAKPLRLLRLDLAIIVALQLAALAYGIYVFAQARPVYILFVRDRFEITSADDLTPAKLADGPVRFRSVPWWGGPRLAAAVPPLNPAEQLEVMMSGLAGADLKTFPKYYVPYEAQADEVKRKGRPLAVLRARYPEASGVLARAIERTGLPEARLLFLPLRGKKQDVSVLVDASTGRIAGFARIDPWVS
jgi:hypothetical protein